MSEAVIVRGEKPTEEEEKEIKAARAREKVRACARRRKEKWLFLSTKENLTEEERLWMEKWEVARVKNLQAGSLRRKKKMEAIKASGGEEEAAIKEKRNAAKRKWRERWLYLLNLSERTSEEQAEFEKKKAALERQKEKMAEWHRAHAEEQRERHKQWRVEKGPDSEEVKARNKAAAKRRMDAMSPEQKTERYRKGGERLRIRAAADPAFACFLTVKSRMREVLQGIKKRPASDCPDRFRRYFGCDRETLALHIESQFRDGMTWENRGKMWELDHIVPLSAGIGNADLLMRMNHYRNLQPLTVEENRRKNDSMPEVWPEGVSFTREEIMASYEKYLSEKPKVPPKVTKKTKAVSVSQEG